jgi:hypothetical protein
MLNRLKSLVKDIRLYLVILFVAQFELIFFIQYKIITGLQYFFLWPILGTAFISLYVSKYKRKNTPNVLDYLKLITSVSLPFGIHLQNMSIDFENFSTLGIMAITIYATLIVLHLLTFVTDNLRNMNRKYIVALVVMSFVVLLAIIYAFVQQTLAKEAMRNAEFASSEAERQRRIAEELKAESETKLESFRLKFDSLKAIQNSK